MAVHAIASSHGRRSPHEIRLHRAGNQQRIGALGLSGSDIELQLPNLIPAKRDACAVIAFYP